MLPLSRSDLEPERRKAMMKKFKNNRQYPKNYVRALAKQAREELDEFKKKEERFHLGVLSRISAEDDRQNEILIVLRELSHREGFDDIFVLKELVDKIIIE